MFIFRTISRPWTLSADIPAAWRGLFIKYSTHDAFSIYNPRWLERQYIKTICSSPAEPNDIAPASVSHIAGQPINSTEQEVIGLLLAQQQVFTNSGKLEPSSVYANQSSVPSSVAVVTANVLQPHGADGKSIVIVSFGWYDIFDPFLALVMYGARHVCSSVDTVDLWLSRYKGLGHAILGNFG